MYELSDLLYEDCDALAALARALAQDGVPLLIRRLPATSSTVEALTRAYSLRGTCQ